MRLPDIALNAGQSVQITWTATTEEQADALLFWLFAAQRHYRIRHMTAQEPERDGLRVTIVVGTEENATSNALRRRLEVLLTKVKLWACGARPLTDCPLARQVSELLETAKVTAVEVVK